MTDTAGSTTPSATFRFASSGGLEVTAYRWDPADPPVGIVQLTHGMGEHMQRYGDLAAALTAQGLVVYGQDHRGHGATALSADALGELGDNGWSELVADIGRLTDHIRAEQGDQLPLVLIGHSMGSFAVQQYLVDNSERADAVMLSGTAAIDLLASGLDLDQPLDLSAFNAPFEQRTGFEWLSRDPDQVDLYVADPLCGFGVDAVNGKAMFLAAARPADPTELAAVRSDLPLFIAVGTADPVNGGLALLDPLVQRYKTAGLTDVTVKAYDEARHEIFNETNRDEVFADLISWIKRVLAR
jgi:alpha-beta hydrolase superfamily lysophospholipase